MDINRTTRYRDKRRTNEDEGIGIVVTLAVIIEDEHTIAEVIKEILKEIGMEVLCASNVADGARLLKAHQPDIAIIDVQLRGGSGIGHIEIAADRDIPVLMITGHPEAADELARFDVPALFKPFGIRDLKRAAKLIMADKATYISRISDAVAGMTIERAACIAPISDSPGSAH